MDFAKKMMKKYGWKEGEGLGKTKSGINKPLNAHLKFDTSGFGVDKAEEFNNHWWQRVYNQAANNVKIEDNAGQVSLHVDKNDSVEISTKDYSVKKLKSKKNGTGYNYFLKSSTLTNLGSEVEEPNKITLEDLEMPKFNVLTDEELFSACGGRTAHKGARHGLNLTGKLERIKEQEEILLKKLYEKKENSEQMITDENEWRVVTNKKKSKNETKVASKMIGDEDLESLNKIIYETDYVNKSKKKKKRQKELDNNLTNKLTDFKINKKIKIDEIPEKTLKLSKSSKNIKKESKKSKKYKLNLKSLDNKNMDLDDEAHAIENIFSIRKRENECDDLIENENNDGKNADHNLIDLQQADYDNRKKKKLKKSKISKLKCKDKILAKKIKKTISVLDSLDSFLKIDGNEVNN